jgi:hypothetical protein
MFSKRNFQWPRRKIAFLGATSSLLQRKDGALNANYFWMAAKKQPICKP